MLIQKYINIIQNFQLPLVTYFIILNIFIYFKTSVF